MDKFDGKVLSALENLEKAGVITSTPADIFKYEADVYFNDGTQIVLPFETKNKEDYRSAFHTVCAILDESEFANEHGRYIVGNIRTRNSIENVDEFDHTFENFLTEQADNVDNAAMALINALTRTDASSWNMEYIGAVVDAATTALRNHGLQCCYPYHSSETVDAPCFAIEDVPCYRDGIRCDYSCGEECVFCRENGIHKEIVSVNGRSVK